MDKIAVVRGDFKDHPRSRFQGTAMMLHRAVPNVVPESRYSATRLTSFKQCDGFWEKYFAEAGEWTRGITAAGLSGVPLAGATFVFNDFLPGQKALLTWANAFIGGTAALAASRSTRPVRFQARFDDGLFVEGKVEEQKLMKRLPAIVNALAKQRRV